MKLAATFLILCVLFGTAQTALAQDDPAILLKIANHTANQISEQIDDSSVEIKDMFQRGIDHVNSLHETADADSAKEHFLAAMKIFKEISSSLSDASTLPHVPDLRNPTSDLMRLYMYVESLKLIVQKHDTQIDFSMLDEFFDTARQQADEHRHAAAFETIQTIKAMVIQTNQQLRDQVSEQESEKARDYAQKYLEKIDRLIENSKKQDVSDDVIAKLEAAKRDLSFADNPAEIVQEIKKIISIKIQFELTKYDILESRIFQLEKMISDSDQILLQDSLEIIKEHLANAEFDKTNEMLLGLEAQLEANRAES